MALPQAPCLAARKGKGLRRLVFVGQYNLEPHGVAVNASLVRGRQIARWIVPADGPTVLRRESPTCHELPFRIGLDGFQYVAVRAIEFQRSALRGNFHADVIAAPDIGRCTRVLPLLQVRCWRTRQHESAREHDYESANAMQFHFDAAPLPSPPKTASILDPSADR